MASRKFLQVLDLDKGRFAELEKHANALGMTAERYARQLIEDGLRLEKQRAMSEQSRVHKKVRQ